MGDEDRGSGLMIGKYLELVEERNIESKALNNGVLCRGFAVFIIKRKIRAIGGARSEVAK